MENLAIENTDNNNSDKKSNIVVNQKSNFRRGSVELMVLYLLSQKDCYGYQLTQLIEELTDGVICIPIGSLYAALYKLIDAGYISDDKRLVGKRMERVYYHIEDTGRERLKILLEDYSATTIAIQTVLAYHPTKEKESRRKKD